MSEFNIERFIEAQNGAINGYAQALGEINNGRKTGHWIWYVFPQMRGLVLERSILFRAAMWQNAESAGAKQRLTPDYEEPALFYLITVGVKFLSELCRVATL